MIIFSNLKVAYTIYKVFNEFFNSFNSLSSGSPSFNLYSDTIIKINFENDTQSFFNLKFLRLNF